MGGGLAADGVDGITSTDPDATIVRLSTLPRILVLRSVPNRDDND